MRHLAISLTCLAVLVPALAGCGGDGAAGADSEIAFVTSRDGDYAIYGMRADGSGEGRLSDDENETTDAAARVFFQTEPAWSPDGTKIAFVSRRDGRSHVYVMGADGEGTTRLTTGAHNDSSPTWSPDGRWIAFERDLELYVMAADGSGVRRVTKAQGGEERDPAWSPDGKWLAYVYRKPGYVSKEIWRVRPDGTGSFEVTKLNVNSGTPTWSPDGGRITFSSNANDGHYQLYEIGLDGKGIERLTFQPGEYFDPSWSPDGKTLVFERDGIVYSRGAGGVETALTDGPNDGSPAWRPAGAGP